jgi:hypothetical protein
LNKVLYQRKEAVSENIIPANFSKGNNTDSSEHQVEVKERLVRVIASRFSR